MDFRFFLTLLINSITRETVQEPRSKTTRAHAFSLTNISLNFLEFYSLANWTCVSMRSAKGRLILPPSPQVRMLVVCQGGVTFSFRCQNRARK